MRLKNFLIKYYLKLKYYLIKNEIQQNSETTYRDEPSFPETERIPRLTW